jgi:hypothetical protein
MSKRGDSVHLHMGCGESLNKELRKDQRRQVNQQSDGASISRPIVAKKSGVKGEK